MKRLPATVVLVLLVAVAAFTATAVAQPTEDRLGWENGYRHNTTIDVGSSVSDQELRAVVSRAMARVELIRGREFNRSVGAVRRTREEVRGNSSDDGSDNRSASNQSEWNNQVWEALWIVGEDRDVSREIGGTVEESVGGAYAGNNITVVTATNRSAPDEPTLAHELVHALQDQRYNLSAPRFEGRVQDEQLGVWGLLEGEANYVRELYRQRCRSEWDCLHGGRADGGGSGSRDFNLGVYVTIFQPYSDGPAYVHHLVSQDGWSEVDRKFSNPPQQSETIIHHEPDADKEISFNDTSTEDWRLWRDQGIEGYDVAGEASVFALLWYQARRYGVPVVDANAYFQSSGAYDTYSYESTPSVGWAADRIYPYHDGDQRGYVWVSRWDSPGDAREFRDAYLQVLRGHDAERVNATVWSVPNGSFADAFRVWRTGDRVTVVNAPSVEELDEIHPLNGTPTQSTPLPGFTAPVALAALALLVGWLYRRKR